MENEKWLPVVGFEDRYHVSNHGRIKSLQRNSSNSSGQLSTSYKEIILRPRIGKRGYHRYNLYDGKGSSIEVRLHILVYSTFSGIVIPNGMVVMHLDDDKNNNCFDNLRLGTQAENIKMLWEHGRGKKVFPNKGNFGILSHLSKRVMQLSGENEVINTFYGISEASRETKINRGGITKCCLGKIDNYKGYKWKYCEN